MTEISAVVIRTIDSAAVTDDGEHMLLKMTQRGGAGIVLAVPRGELLKLVDTAVFAKLKSDQKLEADPNLRDTFRVEWWEIAFQEDGSAVLTLTFGLGGKLSFQLWGGMPKGIFEALQFRLGSPTPTVTGGAVN